MTQRLHVGTAEAVNAFIGATQARRVFNGNTLVWEHPDYPTLAFTSGSLPSTTTAPSAGKFQVTYARPGVAYAWTAGSPEPVLVQIAADTPRFSVCPPGVDGAMTGQAMGMLFEPTAQNQLPYGRAAATGWTSANVTPGTATGIDAGANAARTLTATANGGLHYRTTPPASQTAKWVFSAWVKRITGMGKVWLTLRSGVEIDISAALANFYIDGSSNHQYAWARVYVAIPGVGPWYGDINTCDRIGFRIDESGDAIAVDALQLEIGDYPTSEILNGTGTLNTRSADRLLIDTNVGGSARKYLLDADTWAADATAAALLWRIRQERHIARILIEPNGGNWDIDLQTPSENRPNMGRHDGAPSPVLYSIGQPEGIPVRDQVYASGYVIEAASFGGVDFTAPVLSALSATPTAPTTADLSVTTDSADGTIYWVVTTVNGTPSVEQIKAGKNSIGVGATYASTTAVASSGVKTKAATGLAASTTYYLYVMHQDAAGNCSAVGATSSWATPSAYTPKTLLTAATEFGGVNSDWFCRSASGFGGTAANKYSYAVVFEQTSDPATNDQLVVSSAVASQLYLKIIGSGGSNNKLNIRAYDAAAHAILDWTSTNTYAGQKVAVFVAVDYTNAATNGGKARIAVVKENAGAWQVAETYSADDRGHAAYNGINLGATAYKLGLGYYTPGSSLYLPGKVGMFWFVNDYVDWSQSGYKETLVEVASGVLRPKDLDFSAAANAAVGGISPSVWVPANNDAAISGSWTVGGNGTAYNKGTLAGMTLGCDGAAGYGNW